MVVAVNEADAIAAVIRLQQEFGFRLVLLGMLHIIIMMIVLLFCCLYHLMCLPFWFYAM